MWYRTPADLREYNKRNDAKAVVQCVGFLLLCSLTGWLTWNWWPFVILHGTACSFLSSGMHELAHQNMFNRRWLGVVFTRIYEFLSWTSGKRYWKNHLGHHRDTLQYDDPEVWIVLRDIEWMSWIWECVFNLPKFIMSLFMAPAWIILLQATAIWLFGWKSLLVLTFAPFLFGGLQFLCSYPQHAGLPQGVKDFRQCCRSVDLPSWLSFLYWHMEHHIEHHMYYSVPCYNLKRLSSALAFDMPSRTTLMRFWSEFPKRTHRADL